MSSPAENAATVRAGIAEPHRANNRHEYKQALVALAALLAQAEAGADVEEWHHDRQELFETAKLLKKAEADRDAARELEQAQEVNAQRWMIAAEDMKAERDAAVRLLGQIKDDREVLYRQWEDAVRERDRLREALNLALMHLEDRRAIAAVRAALTGEGKS